MKRKRNRYTTFTFYDLKWKRILFTFRTERTIGFRYRRRYIERDRYGRTLQDFKLTMDDGWAVKRESTILRESTFGLRGESERFNPDVSDILSTEDRYRVAPRRGKRAAFWTGGRKVARLRFEYRRKYHFFFRREQQFRRWFRHWERSIKCWNHCFRWRTPFTAPPPLTAIWQYVCAAKTWTLCWTWRFINRVTCLHSLRWSTTRSFRTSLTTWWKILRCSTGI